MNGFPFTMIGFDLDGTLVDSNRDLTPAINHALALAGHPPVPITETYKLIGGGGRLMLSRAFEVVGDPQDDAAIEQHYAHFLDHYSAHIADHTIPYPGCLDALDRLAQLGCSLAVVTNKTEDLARKLLDQLGMTGRFAAILGGDTLGHGRAKPAPDMIYEAIRLCGREGNFAMVGDSTYDVRAAAAAGVPCAVFSFGYNDCPPRLMGASAVLDHYHELVPALAALRG
jgi:phosphoglycolate phosphatase